MNRSPWLVAVFGCLLVSAGCAKRVPSPDMNFEAQQKVVLKFPNGQEIEGRMDKGRKVLFREPGSIWSAQVDQVSDDKIVLTDLVEIRSTSGVRLQVDREADARLHVTPAIPTKEFLRNEIVGVDLLKTDPARTARNATFWTFSAAVLTILLGEKS